MSELSSTAWMFAGRVARQLLMQRGQGSAIHPTLFRVEMDGEHQEPVDDDRPIEAYLEHLGRQGYDRFVFAHDTDVTTPDGAQLALVLFVGEGAAIAPIAFLHQQSPMHIAGVPNDAAQRALMLTLRGEA